MLGAVATVLDLLFKPGVRVRILGGSLEQSSKMYEHLLTLLDRPMLGGVRGQVLANRPTQRHIRLTNGSEAAILAGSQRSVRGTRVHKLRCDEVEEFDPDVWRAAQMVTRSEVLHGLPVRGTLEAFSTMHRSHGLMSGLVAAVPDALSVEASPQLRSGGLGKGVGGKGVSVERAGRGGEVPGGAALRTVRPVGRLSRAAQGGERVRARGGPDRAVAADGRRHLAVGDALSPAAAAGPGVPAGGGGGARLPEPRIRMRG